MRAQLLLPENVIYFLALFGAIFTVITISFDFTGIGIPLAAGKFLTYLGLLCSFVTAVVLTIDVFRNDIPGKFWWTFGFLISGGITGIFYLRGRPKYFLRS